MSRLQYLNRLRAVRESVAAAEEAKSKSGGGGGGGGGAAAAADAPMDVRSKCAALQHMPAALLATAIQSLQADVDRMDDSQQKMYTVAVYRRAIELRDELVATKCEIRLQQAAFWHAFAHLDKGVMQSFTDAAGLGSFEAKRERVRFEVFMDHSQSMTSGRDKLISSVTQVLDSLMPHYYDVTFPDSVTFWVFGDAKQELVHANARGRPLSPTEYRVYGTNPVNFDGAKTEFCTAWNLAANYRVLGGAPLPGESVVSVIFSDGEFNGRDVPLQSRANVRAVVFYAPEWAPAQVTVKHAQAIRQVLPPDAVYNGDIPCGRIEQLGVVLAGLIGGGGGSGSGAGAGGVPDLPGRCRLGLWSVPKLMLMPVYMQKCIRKCMRVGASPAAGSGSGSGWRGGGGGAAAAAAAIASPSARAAGGGEDAAVAVFLTRLTEMWKMLTSSARLHLESCFEGELFAQLMSLNPCVSKMAEAHLAGKPEHPIVEPGGDVDNNNVAAGENKSSSAATGRTSQKEDEIEPGAAAVPPSHAKEWLGLMDAIGAIKSLLSGPRGFRMLQEKYKVSDPSKLVYLDALYQRATSVSERVPIFEARGRPAGCIVFPECKDADALAAMFFRLRHIFRADASAELDALWIRQWQGAKLEECPVLTPEQLSDPFEMARVLEFKIPYWRTKKGAVIDIVSAIRFWPVQLRIEQKKRPDVIVSEDNTLQPKTAKRFAYVLHVAVLQQQDQKRARRHGGAAAAATGRGGDDEEDDGDGGASFPRWLVEALEFVTCRLDPTLTDEAEEENTTPWWMHILLQLLKRNLRRAASASILPDKSVTAPLRHDDDGKTIHEIQRLTRRLVTSVCCRFVHECQPVYIPYKKPLYPGVLRPWIDSPNPRVYAIFEEDEAKDVEGKTTSTEIEITDPIEIEKAWRTNLRCHGGYLRPMMWTGGRTILWRTPKPSEIMTEHVLTAARELKLPLEHDHVRAHMHTLSNLGGPLVLTGKPDMSRVQDIRVACAAAPLLMEDERFHVPALSITHHVAQVYSGAETKDGAGGRGGGGAGGLDVLPAAESSKSSGHEAFAEMARVVGVGADARDHHHLPDSRFMGCVILGALEFQSMSAPLRAKWLGELDYCMARATTTHDVDKVDVKLDIPVLKPPEGVDTFPVFANAKAKCDALVVRYVSISPKLGDGGASAAIPAVAAAGVHK